MLALVMESTLRSVVLFAAVWLLLKMTRLNDLRVEKRIWTAVILISLAMPLLIRCFTARLPAEVFSVQIAGRALVLLASHSRKFGVRTALWDMYLLVAVILVARFGRGLWRAAAIRRSAQRLLIGGFDHLDLRASHQVRAPASFGSTILLPPDWQTWNAGKLNAVIAHESAHIRQHDCYRLWLATLYGAMFWCNPCAIWLRQRLTMLAELDSDEAAVAVTGDRIGYAEVLLNMATDAQPPPATIGMARPSTLSPRLTRLLESDMSSMKLSRFGKCLLMSAITLTAATAVFGATAPLVLTEAQDSAVNWVSGESLGKFYPLALRKRHVEGMVTCRVTIDATGQVTDAAAVAQDPADAGLALAAVEAVKTFHFNNSLARPVIKVMAVRFQLNK